MAKSKNKQTKIVEETSTKVEDTKIIENPERKEISDETKVEGVKEEGPVEDNIEEVIAAAKYLVKSLKGLYLGGIANQALHRLETLLEDR